MSVCKTPIAARKLGTSYYRLISLLRAGKLRPPGKDSSGDYVWTDQDLEAARSVLTADTRRKKSLS